MTKSKFAFIICTNNDIYLSECIHYLNMLYIPNGYETELITVYDATSMTAGYNEGMQASDAKYKIYLHQDVFIINRYFLYDILDIFNQDTAIGMIGMVGYPTVSRSGFMWLEKRLGADPLYGSSRHAYSHSRFEDYRYKLFDGYNDVALLDGLMMITAYDLPWDEENLADFDFYDAFQSMNFLLHGYRIVCPVQHLPWFIHDDGHYTSMWKYEQYRQLFIQKYGEYLNLSYDEIRRR